MSERNIRDKAEAQARGAVAMIADAASEEISRLTARVAELEKALAWQPIETAPKDGTDVLITGGTYWYDAETFQTEYPFSQVKIARHYKGQDEWNGGHGSEYDAEYWHKPTHWMPLPPAPSEARSTLDAVNKEEKS